MLEIRISQSILRRDNVEAPRECRRSLVPLYVPVHGIGEVGQRCRYMHLTTEKKLDNTIIQVTKTLRKVLPIFSLVFQIFSVFKHYTRKNRLVYH